MGAGHAFWNSTLMNVRLFVEIVPSVSYLWKSCACLELLKTYVDAVEHCIKMTCDSLVWLGVWQNVWYNMGMWIHM